MALPTRTDVIEVLKLEKGKGVAKMEKAIKELNKAFPELTDEQINRILNDLESYTEYNEEKKKK